MACQSVRLARSVRYLPKFSLYSRSCRELHLLPVIQVLPRQLQNIPDALLVAGTTSRLQLSGRPDLGIPCVPDAENAEVIKILEINGEDVPNAKLIDLRNHAVELVEEAKTQLSQRRAEISENVRAHVDYSEARLEDGKALLEQTVNELFDSLRDQLADRDTVRDELDDFVTAVKDRVDEVADELEDSAEQFLSDLRDRIDEFVASLTPSLDGPIAEFAERLANSDVDLDELKAALQEALEQVRKELEDRLDHRRLELRNRMQELREQFEDDVDDVRDELRDAHFPSLPNPDLQIPGILDNLAPQAAIAAELLYVGTAALVVEVLANLQTEVDDSITSAQEEVHRVYSEVVEVAPE